MVGQTNKVYEFIQKDLALVDDTIKNSIKNKEEYINAISDYLIFAGGKRIRPLFAILAAKLFNYGGDKHIFIAAAVECIHSATLLHDDVVDESKLRRGNQASHLKWGNKCSILVGDFLFSQAFGMMVKTESIAVLNTLANAASIIAEGEVMQLSSINDISVSEQRYIEIVAAKTAELFAASTKASSIIACQNNEITEQMYNFGRHTGIAFQIIDDILDYCGDSAKLGKNIGDDFYEGKVTLPILYAFAKADPNETQWLTSIFKKESRTEEELSITKDLLEKYQAINQAKILAKEHIQAASNLLLLMPRNQANEMLQIIIASQLERIF